MRHPRGVTVTVRRSSDPDVDEYGDRIPGTTTTFTIADCAVAPRFSDSTESTDREDQGVQVGYTVYAPIGADVRFTDQIVINGETCDVDGRPGVWVSPFAAQPKTDGLEIRAKFVEGS